MIFEKIQKLNIDEIEALIAAMLSNPKNTKANPVPENHKASTENV
jgi:hypothetical protein